MRFPQSNGVASGDLSPLSFYIWFMMSRRFVNDIMHFKWADSHKNGQMTFKYFCKKQEAKNNKENTSKPNLNDRTGTSNPEVMLFDENQWCTTQL